LGFGDTCFSFLLRRTPDHGVANAEIQEESFMSNWVRFLQNESGATAIEYGLIAAGISVAIIAVVQGVGTKLNATFASISTALE
jgi:pilus assembly protein Flp/PilA